MRAWNYLRESWINIKRNFTRSTLTMLGIIIGVGSVVLLNTLGNGAQSVILGAVSSIGSNAIFINPGRGDDAGPPNLASSKAFKQKDVDAIKRLDGIDIVMPVVVVNSILTYEENDMRGNVIGSTPDAIKFYGLDINDGRFLTEADDIGGSRVAVIGSDVADTLYPYDDPVGKLIKLDKKSFQIIGVLKKRGAGGFANLDKRVYVPLSSAQIYLSGNDYIQVMGILANGDINTAMNSIRLELRDLRNIDNPENDLAKDDFRVASQQDIAEILGTVTTALQVFLTAIAAISLIVGGIGIMNIMLVAVTERTREIGLRKALGATPAVISKMFLVEAILLCSIGGIIGILGGLLLGYIISLIVQNFVLEWNFVYDWSFIILALGISSMIGMIFGFYPAKKASLLQPVESLRYE